MATPLAVRRMLVGVDERPQAEDAVRAGIRLARAFSAQIDLVHALPLPQPLRGVGALARWVETTGRIEEASRELVLARVRAALATEAPEGIDGKGADELLEIVHGKPVSVLAQEVERRHADLIVLGAHAKHPGFDFGNTARALLSASQVPVWVQPGEWTGVKRLLVPIDLSEGARDVLEVARAFGAALRVGVDVIHSYEPPFFAYQGELPAEVMPTYVVDELRGEDRQHYKELLEDFSWEGVQAATHWTEGRPAESVLERTQPGDLIVMGTHGRGTFLSAFLGSEAMSVLRKAQTPVLVVPLHPAEPEAA